VQIFAPWGFGKNAICICRFTNNHPELDGDGGRSNGNNRFLMEDEEDEVDASQTQTQQGTRKARDSFPRGKYR
jgi:hypothetical protein